MNNIEFRLYNRLNSSFFDLIKGYQEPKQTKGFGMLLSSSPEAFKAFLSMIFPNDRAKVTTLIKARCVIDCESIQQMETTNSYRADIIFRFYDGVRPICAIFLEAKSISIVGQAHKITEQVKKYLGSFKVLSDFDDIRVVLLTRNKIPCSDEMLSITWGDILERFKPIAKTDKLVNDYCSFLTGISGAMKFYEKEVISIPANKTIDYVEDKEVAIYECPEGRRPYTALHKKALFLAFRGRKGVTKKLYKIEDKVVMRLDNNDALDALDNIKAGYKERLKEYIKRAAPLRPNEEKQIFFLDLGASITLPYPALPGAQNNSNYPSYNIADFFQKPDDEGCVNLPHK